MSRMLVAAGRLMRKTERRDPHAIVVVLHLEGEEARRFESYRGDKCPRDAARELMFEQLTKVEERYREIEEEFSAN